MAASGCRRGHGNLRFCIAGIVTVMSFFVSQWDGLGLVGAILLYFGIGAMVMRWREAASSRKAWGHLLLAAGLVIGGIGFVLLGHLRGRLHQLPLIFAALALLVLLPLALSLLSEEAISWLSNRHEGRAAWRVRGVVGGLAVFGVVALVASVWAVSPLVLAGMASLGPVGSGSGIVDAGRHSRCPGRACIDGRYSADCDGLD